ncbi:MAG: xanthine dehydrogenase accessory factor [Clostridiales bacterium]|nr:xanthine dehydrogenase accessory factor [Clostridiales bacterium]
MRELFEAIRELNPNAKNILATGIEGPLFGEKIVISEDKAVFCTSEQLKLFAYFDAISKVDNNQKLTIEESTFYCEVIGSEKKLVICGGGHVSIPVIQMGKMLGFHVTVLEDRPFFADNARRAGADVVLCENFEAGLAKIAGDNDTFFVIVTRGHRFDMVCLEKIVPKPNAYIGMIGSKLRVKKVLEAVRETLSQHSMYQDREEALDLAIMNIYSPIGLKIKAETPEEIAVSIMAELIMVKNGEAKTNAFTKDILKAVFDEEKRTMGKVLATIISRKGSAPRGIGTKMIFLQDGSSVGTIGGGCAESDVQKKSILLMNEKTPKIYKVDMTGQDAEEDGMVCGGVIEVLLEPFH